MEPEAASVRIKDWRGGINRALSDFEIEDTELVEALNCFLEKAAIIKRPGIKELTSTAIDTADVRTIYEYYKESTATSYLLCNAGTKIYKIDKGTGAATAIITGLTSGYDVSYATINDYVYMSNGKDRPWKWDGTTATQLSDSLPKAKYLIVHYDKLFYVATQTNPNYVYFSQPATPETVDADAFFEVYTTDGDILTGVASLFGYLILFKNYSVHRLQGASKAELLLNSNLMDVYPNVGCVSHKTIAPATGGLIFLSAKYVKHFDAVTMRNVDGETEYEPKKVGEFIEAIPVAKRNMCSGFWDGKRYRLSYLGSGETEISGTLVCHLESGGWSRFDYGVNDAVVSRDGKIYGARDDGYIFFLDSGLSDRRYDTTLSKWVNDEIEMIARSKVYDADAPYLMKVFRRGMLDVYDSTADLELEAFVDRGRASWLRHFVIETGLTHWGDDWATSSGTVAVTNGSPNVTGTDVDWDEVLAGDNFKVDGDDKTYTIQSVDAGAGTLVLTENYTGATAAGKDYVIWNDETMFWSAEGMMSYPFSFPKRIKGRNIQYQFREKAAHTEFQIFSFNFRYSILKGEK